MKNHLISKKIRLIANKKYNDIYHLTFKSGFDFNPGQFFMLSIPGFGEAPFTPINLSNRRQIEFLIKNVGQLTNKLCNMEKNQFALIRGPYGNGINFKKLEKKNISLMAGGCGLAPINSILEYLYKKSSNFGQIQLFYGVNTTKDFTLTKQLNSKKNKIEIIKTVAKNEKGYRGNIGFIDRLIDSSTIKKNTIAILCGPPAMYKPIINKLLKLGVKEYDIYLQLERKMHCGVGTCQHCTCGTKRICQDGPIFTYKQLLLTNTEI